MTVSEKFTGSNPKWLQNLRTFGDIGITYNNQKIKGKLDNRGYPCMFIGYTEDHASDVYVLFNLNNQAIFITCNLVWLHKLFHQHMKTKSALIPGFTAYNVTPATTNSRPIQPAVAPTNAPAPITQRLTRAATSFITLQHYQVLLQVKTVMMMMTYLSLLLLLMHLLTWLILTLL
jgi:hypothetical protein